jgi:hypothetical protein
MPDIVTVPAVTLLRTGTYSLSTGERTFAEEDLRAAADAFATDAGVKAPRIKIDSLEAALGLDPAAHGGEPALGWVDNLAVAANGQELTGDFHVPDWLAESMEWAYPSLSIEGTAPGWTSSTGRSHELVVTAVALLGVHWPGVTTLDDFREVMATGAGVEIMEQPDDQAVLARMPVRERPLRASLDADLVIRRFIDFIDDPENRDALPEGVTAWNLWPRAMRFDDAGKPYLKVTDEESGSLYRIDFSVAGSDVTFGDFQEVVEQDVPVAAGAPSPSTVRAMASREAARAVRATATEEGTVPLDLDALRTRLGLAADADEDAINAALAAEANPGGGNGAGGSEPKQGSPEGGAPEGGREGEPPAQARGDLTVTVSREQWNETQARLSTLEETHAERTQREATEQRDTLVRAAVTDGRIAPAERDRWREALDTAPEATAGLLAQLTPNKIPVHARGTESPEGAVGVDGEGTGWFNFESQEA